jgi:uncharacterized protein
VLTSATQRGAFVTSDGRDFHADFGFGKFSHGDIASTLTRKKQELIILPTEKCNFRCTYCYEDFLIGKMKPDVQAAIERLLDRRIPELAVLSISWFGGEPLVARDVVLRLSKYASLKSREHGVSFNGGLTTNAYLLTPALFEELVSYDQTFFQITLDGWEEKHDAVRRQANGKGTFSRIWDHLVAMRQIDADFRIQLRIHVRRDNFESIAYLLKQIAVVFGSDPRFTLDFEHLRDLGGEGGKSVERPLTRAELADVEREFRRIHAEALTPTSDVALPHQEAIGAAESAFICYAAKANSLLIRADGRIGKCTVALSDARNTIGSINSDGTVSVDNGRLRPWLRGLSELNEAALECPLVGLPRSEDGLAAVNLS